MGRRAASEALSALGFAAELLGDACPVAVDVKAVTALAWSIRSVEGGLAGAAHLPGMTPLVTAVVDDALADREPAVLRELQTLLPPGVLALRRVKGLGPKKAQRVWRELGVESLGELEYACRENRLVTLDGFGDKTQASILAQLQALAAEEGLMRRDQAQALAAPVVAALAGAGARVVVCGALRRGCELVDEVVLLSSLAPAAPPPARVRVVVADVAHFGVALLRATGSVEHVALLQARADARGIDFNTIAGDDEDAVYAALGLLPVAPEQREATNVLVEVGKARPKLVSRKDLRGALHNHTTASDGADDVVTMLKAAAAHCLSWLGISDHSVAAAYAHGLDAKRLRAQRDELQAANGTAGVTVLAGVESDILANGDLDLDDSALAPLDVVVASMHQRFGLRGEAMTARLVRAAMHPLVDVIGHPTGRLLLSRAPAEFDVSALLAACAASGCAVELNANPARLDLAEVWLREAKERGVLVSIAADAHAADELSNLEHGVALARRAGLTADDVLNTRSADDIRAFVAQRRTRAGARKNAGISA